MTDDQTNPKTSTDPQGRLEALVMPGIAETIKRCYDREAQRKHRGGRRCIATDFEDACILLAWAGGEISEGTVARALGVGRIDARMMRDELILWGANLARLIHRSPVA